MSVGTRSGITSAATCDPDSRRHRRTADRPLWSTERTVSGRWSCECKRMSFTVREKRKPETVPLRTPKRFPCYGVKFRGTSRKSCLKILDFVCPPRNETSPLEERISIYLFGRSRVGAAIPKVVTVSRIGGQTLSEYAAVSFPESRRNVKGDSVHARGCRARHRHRCVLQKNFSQTTGMNPPKNIQSII